MNSRTANNQAYRMVNKGLLCFLLLVLCGYIGYSVDVILSGTVTNAPEDNNNLTFYTAIRASPANSACTSQTVFVNGNSINSTYVSMNGTCPGPTAGSGNLQNVLFGSKALFNYTSNFTMKFNVSAMMICQSPITSCNFMIYPGVWNSSTDSITDSNVDVLFTDTHGSTGTFNITQWSFFLRWNIINSTSGNLTLTVNDTATSSKTYTNPYDQLKIMTMLRSTNINGLYSLLNITNIVNLSATVSQLSPANQTGVRTSIPINLSCLANSETGTFNSVTFEVFNATSLGLYNTTNLTFSAVASKTVTYNATYPEARWLWTCTGNSTLGTIRSPTNRSFITDDTNPLISAQDPRNTRPYTNPASIPINITANDTIILDTCFYNIDNTANATITNCKTSSFAKSPGTYTFYAYANDTAGNTAQTNNVFTVFGDKGTNFTNMTMEGGTNSFNFTTQFNASASYLAILYYNNTAYPSTGTFTSGQNITFTRDVSAAPLVEANFTEKTFQWNTTISYNGGTDVVASAVERQRVYQMKLGNCTDPAVTVYGANSTVLNFNFVDEITRANVSVSLGGTIRTWTTSSASFREFTFALTNTSTTRKPFFTVCGYDWHDYNANVFFTFNAPNYAPREYSFTGGKLNATTPTLINVSMTTLTSGQTLTVIVQSEEGTPLEGYTVEVYRYDPATNADLFIESKVTNVDGQITTFLDTAIGNKYRFKVKRGTTTYLFTNPAEITSTPVILTIQLLNQQTIPSISNIYQLPHDLKYDKNTFNVTATWNDPAANLITRACLKLYNQTAQVNLTLFSTQCLTAPTGVLTYYLGNVTGHFTAQLTAFSFLDGIEYLVDTLEIDQRVGFRLFDRDGLIWLGFFSAVGGIMGLTSGSAFGAIFLTLMSYGVFAYVKVVGGVGWGVMWGLAIAGIIYLSLTNIK